LRAKAAMDAGQLVVDEIVLGIFRERLAERDTERGFILDGFPRNFAQAAALTSMLRRWPSRSMPWCCSKSIRRDHQAHLRPPQLPAVRPGIQYS
jgi:hypothetical protein